MSLQPLPSVPFLNYSFSKGGEFMGIARKRVLQLSCEQTDGLGAFTVLDSSPFVSFADLRAAPSLFSITQFQGFQNAFPYQLRPHSLPLGFQLTGILVLCGHTHRQRYHHFFCPAQLERHRGCRGHRSGPGDIIGKWHHWSHDWHWHIDACLWGNRRLRAEELLWWLRLPQRVPLRHSLHNSPRSYLTCTTREMWTASFAPPPTIQWKIVQFLTRRVKTVISTSLLKCLQAVWLLT